MIFLFCFLLQPLKGSLNRLISRENMPTEKKGTRLCIQSGHRPWVYHQKVSLESTGNGLSRFRDSEVQHSFWALLLLLMHKKIWADCAESLKCAIPALHWIYSRFYSLEVRLRHQYYCSKTYYQVLGTSEKLMRRTSQKSAEINRNQDYVQNIH